MTITVDRDMERAFAQLYEVQKQLLSGALSPLQIRKPVQDLLEHKFPEDARFDRFHPMVLSLAVQLTQLRMFNDLYWDNRLTEEQLAAVNIASDHAQRIDDCYFLHVDFGSIQETIEMWWKVMVGLNPGSEKWDSFKLDREHLRYAQQVPCGYEVGISVVRLNLVAHWEPEEGRTVQQVREQAKEQNESLAGAEALAFYAMHDELLRQQDGENLPFVDMAALEATVPGRDTWRLCPCFSWNRDGRRAWLSAIWGDDTDPEGAAPVVLRELQS